MSKHRSAVPVKLGEHVRSSWASRGSGNDKKSYYGYVVKEFGPFVKVEWDDPTCPLKNMQKADLLERVQDEYLE